MPIEIVFVFVYMYFLCFFACCVRLPPTMCFVYLLFFVVPFFVFLAKKCSFYRPSLSPLLLLHPLWFQMFSRYSPKCLPLCVVLCSVRVSWCRKVLLIKTCYNSFYLCGVFFCFSQFSNLVLANSSTKMRYIVYESFSSSILPFVVPCQFPILSLPLSDHHYRLHLFFLLPPPLIVLFYFYLLFLCFLINKGSEQQLSKYFDTIPWRYN